MKYKISYENAVSNRGNRSRIRQVMRRALNGEELTVGFLGGSITQGSLSTKPELCYAYHVYEWWQKTFPKAQKALERFGHIDILINNGGISQRSLVKDTTLAVDITIINTDFLGHVALTKAVLPSMLERREGHIVVTSSIMGKIYTPLRSTYSAAKHALHGFFDSLRAEVSGDNIHVTIVCPTGVKTGISLNAVTGDGTRYGRMDELMTRGLTAEQCADRIIKAVAARKEEVIIGRGLIKYSAYVRRFFPRIYSRLIRRMKVT